MASLNDGQCPYIGVRATMRAPGTKERKRSRSKSSLGRPTCLATLPALVALAVSAPLAAQQGRDLLAWEEPLQIRGEQVFVKEAVGDVVVYEAGDISLVEAPLSEPTGVPSAATTEYKYDDGTFEAYGALKTSSGPAYEQEYAERFRLTRSGKASYVTLCAGRHRDRGSSSQLPFTLNFYRDSGGAPGTRIGTVPDSATIATPGTVGCGQVDLGSGLQLASGNTWVGLAWRNSTGMALGIDRDGPGGGRPRVRARGTSGSQWVAWQENPSPVRTFGIRLGVDHGGTTPDPDPDPDPEPPTSGCTPTTTALQFDGGYKVSMCYKTPEGVVGQAKSGVWASGQSGILWFFDRGNAEVLVKVLDGCAHNGYRWVFVAPVTTVEFNLRVTAPNGDRWTHSNQQNVTATTKSNTSAFKCADEPDGG